MSPLYCIRCEQAITGRHVCPEEASKKTNFVNIFRTTGSLLLFAGCILGALSLPALYFHIWESIIGKNYAGWGFLFAGCGWVATFLAWNWVAKRLGVSRFETFSAQQSLTTVPVRGAAIYEEGTDQGGYDVLWFEKGIIVFSNGATYECRGPFVFNEIQRRCKIINPSFDDRPPAEYKKYSLDD